MISDRIAQPYLSVRQPRLAITYDQTQFSQGSLDEMLGSSQTGVERSAGITFATARFKQCHASNAFHRTLQHGLPLSMANTWVDNSKLA